MRGASPPAGQPASPPPAPEGFEAFVKASYPHLVRLGTLLSADAHHGEDLAQMALVHTLRAWRRLHPHGEPAAYARTVMTRLATKAGRRCWRAEQPTDHHALPEAAQPSAHLGYHGFSSAGHFADQVNTAVDAQRLLATLPTPQRLVLVLRFWMDLSEAQTAAELGCSLGTVKSRTHRALATLRASAPRPGRSSDTGEGDDGEEGGHSDPSDLTDLSSLAERYDGHPEPPRKVVSRGTTRASDSSGEHLDAGIAPTSTSTDTARASTSATTGAARRTTSSGGSAVTDLTSWMRAL